MAIHYFCFDHIIHFGWIDMGNGATKDQRNKAHQTQCVSFIYKYMHDSLRTLMSK